MKISVVVTAYNIEQYINQCIDSVLNQKNINLELVIVVDAPTDNTKDKLIKYNNLQNVNIIFNKDNVGAGLSRRIGIKNTTGDYIMLIDGDDYLDNDHYISDLLKKAIEEDADIATGGITVLSENGSKQSTTYGTKTTEGYDSVIQFWGNNIVYINNRLIRRTLHDKVLYSDRRYVEDTPVIIPMLYYSNKVVYVENPGYIYRMRNDSLTHKVNKVQDLIYKGLCWIDLINFFEENDKNIFNITPLKQYVAYLYNIINSIIIDEKSVEKYKDDWCKFTIGLFNLSHIQQVGMKNINLIKQNYGKS